LPNPSFEQVDPRGALSGWVHAQGTGVYVGAEPQRPQDGARALHIRSDGPVVWLRSDPIPPPPTGSIAMLAWLRVDDPSRQPDLRFAFEWKEGLKQPYPYSELGLKAKSPEARLRSQWAPYIFRIDELPTRGVTDLRVGVDLMGAGDVWIDSLQVYSLWLHNEELGELAKMAAVANFQLDEGRVSDCHRLLDSYFARLLLEHAPAPVLRGPEAPAAASETVGARGPAARQAEKPRSGWERFLPSWPFKTFR
jgi:hypothetical protein